MKITKVFLIEFSDAERTAIENTIPYLEGRSLPAAARELRNVLARYDDGEVLTTSDVYKISLWVRTRLGKSIWSETMRMASE